MFRLCVVVILRFVQRIFVDDFRLWRICFYYKRELNTYRELKACLNMDWSHENPYLVKVLTESTIKVMSTARFNMRLVHRAKVIQQETMHLSEQNMKRVCGFVFGSVAWFVATMWLLAKNAVRQNKE